MTGSQAELKPVRVLITGASQGIGAAIAKVFSKEFSKEFSRELSKEFSTARPEVELVLVARQREKLLQVAQDCARPEQVHCYACDVSDAEQVAALGKRVQAELGTVDVLINNAGAWLGMPVVDMPVAEFDRIVAANLRSVYLMCHQFLPGMIAQSRGDIFNMASTAAYEGYAGVSAYCAAKHAVLGFSKALREEVREHNIRVSCVSPGPTWSPSWDGSGVDKAQLMPAEDVARAFLNIYQMSANVVTEDIVLRPVVGHISSN
ncbi:SDR family oxidoreductase [Spongiibacter sp. KMU-158]|uniref:SDR family oxidoreductase n=1 Tax=Spongiibacter pelagi TaxID=2760804 RepID=A0A927BYQ5_9GAMM|nr:SDR family oxidoreductase [Spongiibacter pelagi]MBD2858015.1 SDR family oxidoreductase [Spongiibacter pelagi]